MGRPLARLLSVFVLAVTTISAADIAGIWTGRAPGRRGDMEDVAFQFKLNGSAITGKLFGDEFDLPIEEAFVSGDQIKFIVTNTNYYNGNQTKIQYTGTIKGEEIELTRTRLGVPPVEGPQRNRQNVPATFTIKRLK
jgi:hypothetical protein